MTVAELITKLESLNAPLAAVVLNDQWDFFDVIKVEVLDKEILDGKHAGKVAITG